MAAGLLAVSQALGLESDRTQPITIEADRLDVDDAKGVSVYRGDVKYTQGTIVLTADEVRIYSTPERALARVEAEGKPATFKQQLDPAGGVLNGEAQKVEYNAPLQQLVLQGAAHLSYCGDEFTSERIEYLAAQDLVKASKGNGTGGRVQVTIQPRARGESGELAGPCHRLKVAP